MAAATGDGEERVGVEMAALPLKHIEIKSEAAEFLSGLLLGDGHLELFKYAAVYKHSSKYEEFLGYLAENFRRFGIEQSYVCKHSDRHRFPNGKMCYTTTFLYCSRGYAELGTLHSEWYRPATEEERRKGRRFIKVVPAGTVLTPTTCLQWYIGDGCLGHPRDYNGVIYEKKNYVLLCSQGFTVVEVRSLVNSLEHLGIKATLYASRDIHISVNSTDRFFDFIGPCPKEISRIYGYKWPRSKK